MKTIKIFVEGKTDKKFIEDYIVYLEIDTSLFDFTVVDLGGKADDRFEKSLPFFKSSDKNLVIVDADGDCAGRKRELEILKTRLDINFDLFLLPNNLDSGELETLLKSIVWEKYQRYFSCFTPFESCIQTVHTDLKAPSLKDKIYIYLCALLNDRESGQRKDHITPTTMQYVNNRFWDINHAYLEPLKQFLQTNLQ
jgi:uncharacterized protein DUF3226